MKQKLIDYVKTEFRSFEEFPPTEMDYAAFAQLSYFDFSVYLPLFGDSILFKDLYDLSKIDPLLKRVAFRPLDKDFFLSVIGNPRFRHVSVLHFQHYFFIDRGEQFAAVTFYLPSNEKVIAFRGTDASLVGWKEDFNMALDEPIESQIDAKRYLETVWGLDEKPLTLVGHSKGGNLAAYAFFSASKEKQKQIKAVYSFDGPGFAKTLRDTFSLDYKSKYCHLVPKESIIGQLYADGDFQIVVDSEGKMLEEHSLYEWIGEEGQFFRVPLINPSVKKAMLSFNEWARSVSYEDRVFLVDALYGLVLKAGIKNAKELTDEKIGSTLKIGKAYKGLDDATKGRLIRIGKTLLPILKETFLS